MLVPIIILSLSLSLDAFGIGIAYGFRNIKITKYAMLIISILSIVFTFSAMNMGIILKQFIPDYLTKFIGASILVIMGSTILYQGFFKEEKVKSKEKTTLLSIIIKSLGISIEIIKDPSICDLDKSNSIDKNEAIYLGIALSMDSISIGICSAICGISSYYLPISVMIFQTIMLILGLNAGRRLKGFANVDARIYTSASGLLLIMLGLLRLVA